MRTSVRGALLPAALTALTALVACSRPRDSEPSTPTVAVQRGQARANGITIAYESFGPTDRETVLLIMGNGSQLTAWPVELCEELVQRGYRVVIYDNRDVGGSTRFDAAGGPATEGGGGARVAAHPRPPPHTPRDMA